VALIGDKILPDQELLRCFAYSKMTVVNEMTERQKYFHMEFVEFMEMLCRVAYYLYHNEKKFENEHSIYGMLEKLLGILFKQH